MEGVNCFNFSGVLHPLQIEGQGWKECDSPRQPEFFSGTRHGLLFDAGWTVGTCTIYCVTLRPLRRRLHRGIWVPG